MSDDDILAGAAGLVQGISSVYVPYLKMQQEEDMKSRLLEKEYDARLKLAKESPTTIFDAQGNVIQTIGGKFGKLGTPVIRQTEEEKLDARTQAKLDREKPKAYGVLNDTIREYDNMVNEAKAIRDDPSLGKATGLFAPISMIPGTSARNIAARLETLKSKTLLNVLSSLKQLSVTGASGFGQLSNIEGDQIKNSVSTLDKSVGKEDFKKSLDRFISEMEYRKENLASTYEDTYGEPFIQKRKNKISLPTINKVETPRSPNIAVDHDAALEWANTNPDDPRAAIIKKRAMSIGKK